MDMLVNLYADLKKTDEGSLSKIGIRIQRALAVDRSEICTFVQDNFPESSPAWVDECSSTLYRHPTGCYIAIKDREVIGFSCYDATAKGMLGPIGVSRSYRRMGIASALLGSCFEAMKMEGYAYAAIGWVSSAEFYEKTCGAIALPESWPSVYSRMIAHD